MKVTGKTTPPADYADQQAAVRAIRAGELVADALFTIGGMPFRMIDNTWFTSVKSAPKALPDPAE